MDSHFLAFASVAALLVVSPGATMVVVADAAIEGGRRAALWTVAGIGTANATMALAAALGVAAIVHGMPGTLRAISMAGAAYLAWLGVRALWRAVRGEEPLPVASHAGPKPSASPGSTGDLTPRIETAHVAHGLRPGTHAARVLTSRARFGRGLLTNYTNASVVIFYTVVVPQFIAPHDVFLPRYLLLGGTHVAMSVVWQGAVGLSVGLFAERMARPRARRAIDLVMGAALLAFAAKIAIS